MSNGIPVDAKWLGWDADKEAAWKIAEDQARLIKEWKLLGRWAVRVQAFRGGYAVLLIPQDD